MNVFKNTTHQEELLALPTLPGCVLNQEVWIEVICYFVDVSNTVNTWKERINIQKDERDSLTRNIATLNDDLKSIRRGGGATIS